MRKVALEKIGQFVNHLMINTDIDQNLWTVSSDNTIKTFDNKVVIKQLPSTPSKYQYDLIVAKHKEYELTIENQLILNTTDFPCMLNKDTTIIRQQLDKIYETVTRRKLVELENKHKFVELDNKALDYINGYEEYYKTNVANRVTNIKKNETTPTNSKSYSNETQKVNTETFHQSSNSASKYDTTSKFSTTNESIKTDSTAETQNLNQSSMKRNSTSSQSSDKDNSSSRRGSSPFSSFKNARKSNRGERVTKLDDLSDEEKIKTLLRSIPGFFISTADGTYFFSK